MFCRQYLTALRESASDIEAAGGKVVAVMQGTPSQAASLCKQYRVGFPCLADPALDTYRTFGLKRGSLSQVAGPPTWAKAAGAMRQGHIGGRAIGDVMQLPGTFIIDRDGVVRYAKYAQHSADHPEIADIIEALRAIAPSAA